ncbi:MAG TPA: YtxH domain-containing protein [Candidatus Acidoferrales bacterium]|nr:YtxH domain-containing protein [Candidatus Acidoferrales bacterium]
MSGRSWGTFTTAFIAGIGIGTAVGMILAPKSGADLRSDLSEAAQDAMDNAAAAGARVTRRARRAASDAVEQVSGAIDAGRREYDRAKNHVA